MVARAGTEQDPAALQDHASQGPLHSALRQLAGGPPTCKCSTEGKAKGTAWQKGENRWQLFFQCMVQPKAGGCCRTTGLWWAVLCWLWREKRLNSKQSEWEHSKSQQERAVETGGRKDKAFELLECTPQADCIFSGWKTEELHCKSLCFSSSWSSPYQQWCAHSRSTLVWKAVTLACLAYTFLWASETLLL